MGKLEGLPFSERIEQLTGSVAVSPLRKCVVQGDLDT
jgi:hypothetical protein